MVSQPHTELVIRHGSLDNSFVEWSILEGKVHQPHQNRFRKMLCSPMAPLPIFQPIISGHFWFRPAVRDRLILLRIRFPRIPAHGKGDDLSPWRDDLVVFWRENWEIIYMALPLYPWLWNPQEKGRNSSCPSVGILRGSSHRMSPRDEEQWQHHGRCPTKPPPILPVIAKVLNTVTSVNSTVYGYLW